MYYNIGTGYRLKMVQWSVKDKIKIAKINEILNKSITSKLMKKADELKSTTRVV